MSCGESGLVAAIPHFDPPSATTLPEVGSLVKVINLDKEPTICYTTDGTAAEWNGGNCTNKLDASRQIAVPKCGFNVIRIAWSNGSDEANYVIDSEACKESCDPVVPWSNKELVQATGSRMQNIPALASSLKGIGAPGIIGVCILCDVPRSRAK
jgi:hypothetical protein